MVTDVPHQEEQPEEAMIGGRTLFWEREEQRPSDRHHNPHHKGEAVLEGDRKNKDWYMVKDATPYDEGGVRPGASYYHVEVAYTVSLRNFRDGTILEHGGVKYTIDGETLHGDNGEDLYLYDYGRPRFRKVEK